MESGRRDAADPAARLPLPPPAEGALPGARPFPMINPRRRDLLCALAYVYLACGQNARALALLRLVERERPNDVGLLRILAYAHIAAGDGRAALEAITRLEALDAPEEAGTPLLLLRSHALRLTGQLDDARRCFRSFVAVRSTGEAEPWTD